MKLKLECLGGFREVGRNGILLDNGKERFLFDYGIHPDEQDVPLPANKVSGLFLGHAHLDHCGAIPTLYKKQKFPVYATAATLDQAYLLLNDSLKIMRIENKPRIFSDRDVAMMQANNKIVTYGQTVETKTTSTEILDAGHIPGSMCTVMDFGKKRVLYTSDFNMLNTRLLNGAKISQFKDIDVLIMESTYGSRDHPPREQSEKQLIETVKETIGNGGIAILPAFAVGRAAEVAMVLHSAKPDFPIYMDGMAKAATEITLRYPELLRNPKALQAAADHVVPLNSDEERSKAIKEPCAVITTSGMCIHPDSWVSSPEGVIKKIKDVHSPVFSVDMKTLSIDRTESMANFRNPSPKTLIELQTSTSYLKTTPDHRLFSLDNDGNVVEKQCKDFEIGDYTLCAAKLPHKGKKQKLNTNVKYGYGSLGSLPTWTSTDLLQFIGYFVGDGNLHSGKHVRFTDENVENLKIYKSLGEKLFDLKAVIKRECDRNRLLFSSVKLTRFIENLNIGKSHNRTIPDVVQKCSLKELAAFLRGLFDAEGTVCLSTTNYVGMSSLSKDIAYLTQLLLLKFGIVSKLDRNIKILNGKSYDVYQVRIFHPSYIREFARLISFNAPKKKAKLQKMLKRKIGYSHIDIVPISKGSMYRKLSQYFVKVPNSRKFSLWKNSREYFTKSGLKATIKFYLKASKNMDLRTFLSKLEKLCNEDILWTKVLSKSNVKSDTDTVIDLMVPGYSNFIVNGFVVHNCEGGPVTWYIKRLYSKPECSLTLTGFQAPKTAGRYLLDTGRFVTEGFDLAVKMKVTQLDFSAHASRTQLLEFVQKLRPEKVICVHGDYCERFATELRGRFAVDAVAPEQGDVVEL